MSLSKKSAQGLGVILSASAILVSGIFVARPLYNQSTTNSTKLTSSTAQTEAKKTQLQVLENGVDNFEEIQEYVNNFLSSVPSDKDIESASRAISNSRTDGINISAFTFGNQESVKNYTVPKSKLGEYTSPFEIQDTSSSTEDSSSDGSSSTSGFQRVPVQITVSANSYSDLSQYLDELAQQPRSMSVISVSSARSGDTENNSEKIEATIYAYVFVYAR